MDLALLCGCAFLAGFVDAVVGGGGLIQLPALLIFLPRELASSVHLVFGTNKLASMCGTTVAVAQYVRRVQLRWGTVAPAAISAFVFSAVGVKCVQAIPGDLLRPVVLVLLVLVAVYTYSRKDFGRVHAPRFVSHHERFAAIIVGALLGFYDGIFGPGTGSFLIFIFIGLFRFDFLSASATAKVINLATNVAAVLTFGAAGHILWRFALPMAACNVVGGALGARLAIMRGNTFVRFFFLLVVSAMIARYGWDVLHPASSR